MVEQKSQNSEKLRFPEAMFNTYQSCKLLSIPNPSFLPLPKKNEDNKSIYFMKLLRRP